MRAGAFWRDQLPAVLLNLCGVVALALFLLASGVAAGTIAFLTGVWAVVLALWLGCRFVLQKRRMDTLLALAEQLGLPASALMACGDGGNDTAMVAAAGLGVAMANAFPEVKAAARYVTASNNEDGVARAVETFVLGKEAL